MQPIIYGTVEGATQYLTDRDDAAWPTLDVAKQRAALIRASDYIRTAYLTRFAIDVDVPGEDVGGGVNPAVTFTAGDVGNGQVFGYGSSAASNVGLVPAGSLSGQPIPGKTLIAIYKQNLGAENFNGTLLFSGDVASDLSGHEITIDGVDAPIASINYVQHLSVTLIALANSSSGFDLGQTYGLQITSAGPGPSPQPTINPIIEEATYIAAGLEAATPGFFSTSYTPGQVKVLTEVKGIKWSVVGAGDGRVTPVSAAIDALFLGVPIRNPGRGLGFMVI